MLKFDPLKPFADKALLKKVLGAGLDEAQGRAPSPGMGPGVGQLPGGQVHRYHPGTPPGKVDGGLAAHTTNL